MSAVDDLREALNADLADSALDAAQRVLDMIDRDELIELPPGIELGEGEEIVYAIIDGRMASNPDLNAAVKDEFADLGYLRQESGKMVRDLDQAHRDIIKRYAYTLDQLHKGCLSHLNLGFTSADSALQAIPQVSATADGLIRGVTNQVARRLRCG